MVVGLDIGTSCVRVAIGDSDDADVFSILGTACEESAGLRNGNIVNIEATAAAIKKAIEAAEQNAGAEVSNLWVSIGGDQIEGTNGTGKVSVSIKGKEEREIARDDINRVIECATAIALPLDRIRLHTITQDYIVDGVAGIKDPMHRLGVCLEAKVHIITASKTTVQNVRSCVNRAGYIMEGVLLKTLAIQKAVTTSDERELGSIIIDLGAGTTDVLILEHDAPIYVTSIPVGGNSITNDIAIVKGLPISEAERIKKEYGCCYDASCDDSKSVILNGIGGKPPEEIKQADLCAIIRPRMEEILTSIINKIIEETELEQLSGNIILTGGGANMEGIIELVEDIFETSAVRKGSPERLGGIEENYSGPQWSTVIGLVLSCKDAVVDQSYSDSPERRDGIKSTHRDGIFKRAFKALF